MPGEASSVSDRASALAEHGRAAEAYRLLAGAAAAGEADALFELAMWRLQGRFVRRDLREARDLFRRAAEAGDAGAAEIYTAFLANGAGGPPCWAEAVRLLHESPDPAARGQADLIGSMRLSADGSPTRLPAEERLSDRPHISAFRTLFSAEECAFLIGEALPRLAPSVVIDPHSGRHVPNPVRTSDGMAFGYVQEGPVVHALNRRIAAMTNTAAAQGEPLQVLRYRPGQEYRPHVDALTGEANQRILTVLVYLNEDYEGGDTLFVRTGLRFKGGRGDALVFRNTHADGRADELVQHAGTPVAGGEKLIASRWIRARPFEFPPPRPQLDV